ncbi:MAG TPA: IPT/TIG domain-containing protein [Chryseolinea sp.]|nr:IPT/TIG domain-containing protein [Chryseolinea sp.]
MKTRFFNLAILLFFLGCTKEEITPREFPRVTTVEAADITSDGVTFTGEIIFSNVEVKDHGFVWSDILGPLVSTANKVSLGSKSGIGQFESRCDRSLEAGKKYYVRGYAISEDFVVYGNTVEFMSLGSKAPVVKDFFPTTGTWSDTVTVVGENFSDQNRTNIVKFGQHTATVMRSNKDTLVVYVPYQLNTESSNLSVAIFGNVANLPSKQFTLKAPVIESISPSEGAPGSTVTLTGKFFNGTSTKVYFNGIEGTVQSGTQNAVAVNAPGGLSPGATEVKVVTGSGSMFDITSFTVKPPQLLQISPTSGGEGDEITLTGNFFSPAKTDNIVTFGNSTAVVTSASVNELKVIVPPNVNAISADVKVKIGDVETDPVGFSFLAPVVESFTPTSGYGIVVTITGKNFRAGGYNSVFIGDLQLNNAYASSSTKIEASLYGVTTFHLGKVKVTFESQEGVSAQDFKMSWARLPDMPDPNSYPTAVLTNTANAYVGFGEGIFNNVWRLNTTTKAWTKMANFPGQSRNGFAAFSAGSKGYVGGGQFNSVLNDWWEYNFSNNTWTQKANLSMPGMTRTSFAYEGSGYVLNFESENASSLWRYNHSNDSWTLVSMAPFSLVSEPRSFIADNFAYVAVEGNLWKYNFVNNVWSLVSSQNDSPRLFMNIGGTAYGIGYYNDLKKFNSTQNTWSSEPTPLSYGPSVLFSVNGRGYAIYGELVFEYEP